MAEMLLGSSGNDEIRTPKELFERLNRTFLFNYDAFASTENALLPWFSSKDGTWFDGRHHPLSGLKFNWSSLRVFMNPPYSRGLIEKCIDKAIEERNYAEIIVALVKVDTSTRWWQKLAANAHIDFLPRRVKYEHPDPPPGWAGASFPSAIAIFKKDWL